MIFASRVCNVQAKSRTRGVGSAGDQTVAARGSAAAGGITRSGAGWGRADRASSTSGSRRPANAPPSSCCTSASPVRPRRGPASHGSSRRRGGWRPSAPPGFSAPISTVRPRTSRATDRGALAAPGRRARRPAGRGGARRLAIGTATALTAIHQAGHRAPRLQAGQRAARRGRSPGDRLRHRENHRRERDDHQPGRRHPRLHGARADRR